MLTTKLLPNGETTFTDGDDRDGSGNVSGRAVYAATELLQGEKYGVRERPTRNLWLTMETDQVLSSKQNRRGPVSCRVAPRTVDARAVSSSNEGNI